MQRTLDIRDQLPLGFRRLLEFTTTGFYHRLLRSMVTLAVIATAIAFFVNLITGDLAVRQAAAQAAAEIKASRAALAYSAYVTRPLDLEEALHGLAWDHVPGLQKDLAQFGQISASDMAGLKAVAVSAVGYLEFIGGLSAAERSDASLGGDPLATLNRLADPVHLAAARASLERRVWRRLPGGEADLVHFTRFWPEAARQLQTAIARRNAAAENLTLQYNAKSFLALLGANPETAFAALQSAGFQLSPENAALVVSRAAVEQRGLEMDHALAQVVVRQALATLLGRAPEKITPDLSWSLLADIGNVERLNRAVVRREPSWTPLNSEAIAASARERMRSTLLEKLARADDNERGSLRFRTLLLVAVSMLVCMVGVTNAMLMAVTERFREIATLKCLGALDGTIVAVFLLEAMALGIAGGVLGSLVGLAVAAIRLGLSFGWEAATAFPPGATLLALLGAVALGTLLAAFSAVYPALRAARLAPMEAMRIE